MSSAESQGRQAALDFRRRHALGTQPLGDLVALIEQTTGYEVAILDADPDEHGLTLRDPEKERVYIGVARTPHPMRQRSTLAHELGHVLFEDWDAPKPDEPGERTHGEIRADAFARHLLAPVEGVRQLALGEHALTESDLSTVVQRYLVSPVIAAIALHEAGRIGPATKQEWMGFRTPQLAVRHGWSDQYNALAGDSGRTRAPQRLLSRAVAGYAEGLVSAQTIATLRGTHVEAVVAELDTAGVTPRQISVPWLTPTELPQVPGDLDDLLAGLDTEPSAHSEGHDE